MKFKIHQGDNRDILKTIPDNSIDAIITDPPYGIDFLGKSWDANTGALETYQECLRVLKPGGYILAFSAARTYHHLAITLEQAGFEIRDQLMWLYASGFPKAQDIGKAIQKRQGVEETKPVENNGRARVANKLAASNGTADPGFSGIDTICTSPEAKQWEGWKTALKPAHEPIAMARKPFKGSTIDNVLAHGVGALNIDATRISTDDKMIGANQVDISTAWSENTTKERVYDELWQQHDGGRFPSNVIGEVEGYQKYFYCPKVSRKERHTGFDLTIIPTDPSGFIKEGVQHNHSNRQAGNNHPTVKPVELMKYLIKLVTPPRSVVLDPFCGSGSTGMAAVDLGHEFIGCELDPNYVNIAETRIRAWNDHGLGDLFE